MNYIKEINAFYEWLELNELSKSAVLLWHALMHLNNKSGWQESFTVARSVIEAKTTLKKDAYYIARNQLKQAGLVDFKERGTRATSFTMHSISSVLQTNFQTNDSYSSEKQTTNQTINQTTIQTTPPTTIQTVIKHKQNINSKKDEDNACVTINPFQLFESEGFGTLTHVIAEKINSLIDEFGEIKVCEAMKESVISGVRNLNYTQRILTNPIKRGAQNGNNYARDPQKAPREDKSILQGRTGWIGRTSV